MEPSATRGGWLVSRRFDVAMVAVPLVASLLSLLTLDQRAPRFPLWAYLILIVAFDVAHVWGTIYVTYLDGEILRRRRVLLLATPLLSFVVAYRLHGQSPQLFWTLLAYVAIFHFIKQLYGLIALYKARAGERERWDFYLDKWTLWVGAVGPVLLWHASPARQFDWFNAGESFIARIDPAFEGDVLAIMGVTALVYLLRQGQLARSAAGLNVGKNVWMLAAWVSFGVGIGLSSHPLVSAAFLNLFHGIPFLMLVWHRRNAVDEGQVGEVGRRWVLWLSQRKRWLAFYLVILAPALLEESLWDWFVWQAYLPDLLGSAPRDVGDGSSFWVALLSVPQLAHYYLDAFIWKMDESNPDLRRAFAL